LLHQIKRHPPCQWLWTSMLKKQIKEEDNFFFK
jgi:hypothetical protein